MPEHGQHLGALLQWRASTVPQRSLVFQLNSAQRAAITYVDGPLLVLAGAGSGKTGVITQKIAHLIRHQDLAPGAIAAVTFTNKAAREMKQRVKRLLGGDELQGLRVCTFHTLGLEIIRREHRRLGYRPGFTIFDAQDSAALLHELLRRDGPLADDQEQRLRWQISHWKNQFRTPEQALAGATDAMEQRAAQLYLRYNEALKTYNAVDFDDLISQPALLFDADAEALGAWRERIRYLLVDEYQDTNAAQYQLVRLLVGPRRGLTVVGDDDQSIYAWRGARPDNLPRLAADFPELKVIKLEENYRSTGRILRAANALIANNPHLYDKRLWSRLGVGEPIRVLTCRDGDHEAERTVSQLLHHHHRHNIPYREFAILYRGNHQSRAFERVLREHRIPYHLSGGLSFFERTEIKDLMAYLRLLVNPNDDAAFLRAVNTPRRGVGPGTVEKLTRFAAAQGIGLLGACERIGLAQALGARSANGLRAFAQWLQRSGEHAAGCDPVSAVRTLIRDIDYDQWLHQQSGDPEAARRRLENVAEFLDWLARLARHADAGASLSDLLAQMALRDLLEREQEDDANAVHLMTLHAAKGLEFEHVYLAGMEEDLLPHRNSIDGAIEEERRLAYVGITRARRTLTLTLAARRKRYGQWVACDPSRFLAELPDEDLVWEGREPADPEERKERGQAHLAHLRSLLAEE